ncbi:hypothetical protein A9Q81_06905 [Gammaproteobacteria bacterium 42_54_T18]|nr:hypothetical protein A9Q81_06905 [Gammaproteobacteria bacterium 42_54_T18]
MAYIDDSLSKDEKVEQIFNHHWTAYLFIGFLVIITPITLGISLIFAIYKWLSLRATEQGVTNKRVIYKTGIISRKTEEMKLASVETVEITQGIMGRILGYGNIEVTGTGINDLVFKSIDNPMEVKKSIESIDAI